MNVLRFTSVLLPGLLLLLGGCDSNEDDLQGSDVAGIYRFETFQFAVGSGVNRIEVDVLDTLNPDRTLLEIFTRDRFTFQYEFRAGRRIVTDGRYSISGLRLVMRGTEEDADFYEDVLLPLEFTLRYDPADPDRLHGSIPHRTNLEAFDPDLYQGLLEVQGTLQIVLVLR